MKHIQNAKLLSPHCPRAAFSLGGEDDGRMGALDFDGVALAAIQGVNRKLELEVTELRQKRAGLEAKLAAISD